MAGDFVTGRELEGNLRPIREDIWEIKGDVKTLLLSQAQVQIMQTSAKDKGARRLAWGSLAAACIGGFWWVQDAIAKVAHIH